MSEWKKINHWDFPFPSYILLDFPPSLPCFPHLFCIPGPPHSVKKIWSASVKLVSFFMPKLPHLGEKISPLSESPSLSHNQKWQIRLDQVWVSINPSTTDHCQRLEPSSAILSLLLQPLDSGPSSMIFNPSTTDHHQRPLIVAFATPSPPLDQVWVLISIIGRQSLYDS